MMNQTTVDTILEKERYSFEDLCLITEYLRGENGCPWDREQTHESIRRCMIEEAYEVVEAIDRRDAVLLCEELGDVLFQVVFHAELEREAGRFDAGDVINGICRKMIHRHPHVFGNAKAVDGCEALAQWEAIKTEEKQRKTLASRLHAIPPILPALLRAEKVNEKLGTSEENPTDFSEILAGQAADFARNPDEKKLGELLFQITKCAARYRLDAEGALAKWTEKVISDAEKLDF